MKVFSAHFISVTTVQYVFREELLNVKQKWEIEA
jgi:hypothetical protein